MYFIYIKYERDKNNFIPNELKFNNHGCQINVRHAEP